MVPGSCAPLFGGYIFLELILPTNARLLEVVLMVGVCLPSLSVPKEGSVFRMLKQR